MMVTGSAGGGRGGAEGLVARKRAVVRSIALENTSLRGRRQFLLAVTVGGGAEGVGLMGGSDGGSVDGDE